MLCSEECHELEEVPIFTGVCMCGVRNVITEGSMDTVKICIIRNFDKKRKLRTMTDVCGEELAMNRKSSP